MKKNKFIIICATILILFTNCYYVLADDLDEEIDFNKELIKETKANISDEPNINSRAAIVYDRHSKKILYEKNKDQKRAMASTTKIMTAIIVLEKADLSDIVEVSSKAARTGGSRLGLIAGDKITIRDLLYGLMLKSGNDSAIALAEKMCGNVEKFADLMNSKAKELKLENTNFITPHGLDKEEHYTTALELAKITDYALNIEEFRNIVKIKTYNVKINGKIKTISNTNELLGNLSGVYGVKTGFTNNAGRCLVTSVKRGELDIICVVLGADTKKFRTIDSIKLIEYAFNKFKIIDTKNMIEYEFKKWKDMNEKLININKGEYNNIDCYLESLDNYKYVINKDDEKKVEVKIECEYYIEAPISKEQEIGNLSIYIGKEKILNLKILTLKEVRRKKIFRYYLELILNYTENMEKIFK